jgi:hypothetical protein
MLNRHRKNVGSSTPIQNVSTSSEISQKVLYSPIEGKNETSVHEDIGMLGSSVISTTSSPTSTSSVGQVAASLQRRDSSASHRSSSKATSPVIKQQEEVAGQPQLEDVGPIWAFNTVGEPRRLRCHAERRGLEKTS